MTPASREGPPSVPEPVDERQLDLFAAAGVTPSPPPATSAEPVPLSPTELDDAALIAAIPTAGLADGPALAIEAGRRRLVTAVPALEASCRRFTGFGLDRAIPEQVTALEAMTAIGGRDAARAVARLVARAAVQGPALRIAVAAAARLGADLPSSVVVVLLRHADPEVRADACRCVRRWPEVVPRVLELLDDPHPAVRSAAACALGCLGRREVRPLLTALLRHAPSVEVIDAVTPIADEDVAVLLARIACTLPDLADAALDALEAIDHPRAAQLLRGLAKRPAG